MVRQSHIITQQIQIGTLKENKKKEKEGGEHGVFKDTKKWNYAYLFASTVTLIYKA